MLLPLVNQDKDVRNYQVYGDSIFQSLLAMRFSESETIFNVLYAGNSDLDIDNGDKIKYEVVRELIIWCR